MSPVPSGRLGAASPTSCLPGYVPGMPQPITPRDPILDDDIRSHSTTPRATSPLLPNLNGHVSQHSTTSTASGLLRRGSDTSRSMPRSTSPPSYTPSSPYLPRTISRRRTPDESQRDTVSGAEQDSSTSSILLRRRPVSPLSSTTFQPMSISPRPSTPSIVTWTVGPLPAQKGLTASPKIADRCTAEMAVLPLKQSFQATQTVTSRRTCLLVPLRHLTAPLQ